MKRLEAIFRGDHKVLVAYLCVGDPSVDESVELARACVRAGADVLELGVSVRESRVVEGVKLFQRCAGQSP